MEKKTVWGSGRSLEIIQTFGLLRYKPDGAVFGWEQQLQALKRSGKGATEVIGVRVDVEGRSSGSKKLNISVRETHIGKGRGSEAYVWNRNDR